MSLTDSRIAFVGAGNMAEALIRGLLAANAATATNITATARRQARLDELASAYGIKGCLDNSVAAAQADIIVLAVKPQILDRVLGEIAEHILPETLVISIAAGFAIERIERVLGPKARVCRAMPNTPALIGRGATAISRGAHVTEGQLQQAEAIFTAVGVATRLDEVLLDAVTGLSGSGPAYVFMIIEALSDAGVKVGLPRREAQKLAAHTVAGSAEMLIQTGQHPGVLKDQVTSPGGTAIAGLHTLEEGGLRTTLINAVVAATERARQLNPNGSA